MPAVLFADLIRKDATPGAVHVPTALGNQRRRKPFRPDLSGLVVKLSTGRTLTPMDSQRSHVPFRYDSGALASLRPDQTPRLLGAITDPDSLPKKTVQLSDLYAMQNRVDAAKAKAWASGQIQSDRLPVVVNMNGRQLIADGHHRLSGAWLRGDNAATVRYKDLDPVTNAVKRAEPTWRAVLKIDPNTGYHPDQRRIFGWASVAEINGAPVIDSQGDIIPPGVLEEAAYDFVLHSRDQGDMHAEKGVGRCIESMAFTLDKQAALGIDLGLVGWWTGFQVDSPPLWDAIKRGERPEFSIGGNATFEEV